MRKSVRLRYIRSFLIIVIIPAIIFTIFFYIYSMNNAINEINKARLSTFDQATTQIDYSLKEMNTVALHMSSNLDALVKIKDAFTIEENKFAIQSQLANYEKNLSFESNMGFYIRGQNDIFFGDEKIPYSTFENTPKANVDFPMSSFFSKLNSLAAPYIYRLNYNFLDLTQKEGMITYIFPLPYLESKAYSNIIFLVSEKYFSDIFENAMGAFVGDIYIFNRSMDVVYSNVPSEKNYNVLPMNEAKKVKGTGLLQQNINGDKLVIMRSISEDNNLTYVVSMNENEFYNRTMDVNYPLFLMITAIMLLCILFAIMAAYFNYRPIKSLVHDITGGKPQHGGVNELQLIKDVYDKAINEKMILSTQLDMQNRIMENQFLYRLLCGKCNNADELDYIQSCTKLRFDKKNNMVLVVSFYDTLNKEQKIDRILSLGNSFDLSNGHIYVAEMLSEETVSYVCNFDSGQTDNVRNEIADKIWEFLVSKDIDNIMMGVGSVYDDPMNIKLSYLEAAAALQTALLDGKQYIFMYNKDHPNSSVDYYISAMDKSLLIEGIQHGDEQVTLSALDTLIDQIQSNSASFLIMQLQCFDILNTVLRLLSQEGIVVDSNIDVLDDFGTFNSLHEFKARMSDIIRYACKEIELKRDMENTKVKSKVLAFINDNYCRNDFSLELVSSSLGVTKTRINAILKEDTLCSFIEYVSMLRMEEVKRQLRETDKKIQDIVNSVGYIDVSNFTRKFKNSEGLTPGQYRQLSR